MELAAESCQKRPNLLNQGVPGSGGEGAPMVFGMLPEDFDGMERGLTPF